MEFVAVRAQTTAFLYAFICGHIHAHKKHRSTEQILRGIYLYIHSFRAYFVIFLCAGYVEHTSCSIYLIWFCALDFSSLRFVSVFGFLCIYILYRIMPNKKSQQFPNTLMFDILKYRGNWYICTYKPQFSAIGQKSKLNRFISIW